MKKCSKCGEVKPFSEFYKDRNSSDKHASNCKECDKKRNKIYRNRNKQKIKQYSYLLYDKSLGIYKIGKSVNPKVRFKSHRCSNLSIVYIGKSEINEEVLHEYYKPYNVDLEWFDIPKDKLNLLLNIFNITDKTENTEKDFFNDVQYESVLNMYNKKSHAVKDLITLGNFLKNIVSHLSSEEFNNLLSLKSVYYDLATTHKYLSF